MTRSTATIQQVIGVLQDLQERYDEIGPDTGVVCAGANDAGVPVEFGIEGFSAQQVDGEVFVAMHVKEAGVLIVGRASEHLSVREDGTVAAREAE